MLNGWEAESPVLWCSKAGMPCSVIMLCLYKKTRFQEWDSTMNTISHYRKPGETPPAHSTGKNNRGNRARWRNKSLKLRPFLRVRMVFEETDFRGKAVINRFSGAQRSQTRKQKQKLLTGMIPQSVECSAFKYEFMSLISRIHFEKRAGYGSM